MRRALLLRRGSGRVRCCRPLPALVLCGALLIATQLFPGSECAHCLRELARPASSRYNCTAKERNDPNTTGWFGKLEKTGDILYELYCPGNAALDALYSLDPDTNKTFLNIGANKGYALTHFISRWAPDVAEPLASDMLPYWSSVRDIDACGSCWGCEDRPPPRTSSPRAPGSAPTSGSGAPRFIGVEAAPATFRALAASPLATRLPHGMVTLLHGAGAAVGGGTVSFPNCSTPGDETCGAQWRHFGEPPPPDVPVPAVSVDGLIAALLPPGAPLFYLKIDAEGHDPAILRGAAQTLASGRVTVVEFEYNDVGMWGLKRLGDVVASLDGAGYTCFLEARTALRVLTGCWSSDAYEFWRWSNVLCVRRSRPDLLNALYAMSNLPHVRIG